MREVTIIFFCLIVNISFSQEDFFTVVDKMPVFSEKCDKLESIEEKTNCTTVEIQTIVSKVNYPQKAIDNDIEGRVFVSFVVNKDGSISEITLLRGAHKWLDEASIDHMKNMPSFYKPGYQNGLPVRVKYNVPINFKLGYTYNKPLTKKEARLMRKDTRKKLKALKKN